MPKAFKVIPNLQNWEEILYLTEPESWTPHAVYQVRCRSGRGGGAGWGVAGRQVDMLCMCSVFHPYLLYPLFPPSARRPRACL